MDVLGLVAGWNGNLMLFVRFFSTEYLSKRARNSNIHMRSPLLLGIARVLYASRKIFYRLQARLPTPI